MSMRVSTLEVCDDSRTVFDTFMITWSAKKRA